MVMSNSSFHILIPKSDIVVVEDDDHQHHHDEGTVGWGLPLTFDKFNVGLTNQCSAGP